MPIPAVAGFGKAAQPLGVAADRADGLAQGKKRAQAGRGTAAEVPALKRDEYRGVPVRLHRKMTGRPQRKANPCRVRVRWMRSRQRGLDACRLGESLWIHERRAQLAITFAADCGGGRLRARQQGFEGAEPPAFLLQAPLRARAARRSKSPGPVPSGGP